MSLPSINPLLESGLDIVEMGSQGCQLQGRLCPLMFDIAYFLELHLPYLLAHVGRIKLKKNDPRVRCGVKPCATMQCIRAHAVRHLPKL